MSDNPLLCSSLNSILNTSSNLQANPESHLFLQYEDMYNNTAESIRKIAQFLNIPLSGHSLASIVKNCTITEMRETSNMGLNHLRQGGYGNWRGTFSVALNEFFDDVRNCIEILHF
jgi:Sulfotransferase domain